MRSGRTLKTMREAPTIVLIGAGSTSFGLSTLHDLYGDPVFSGATVWLVDIDARPLERMQRLAAALEAGTQRRITVRATTDRTEALPGADAVIVSVEVDRDHRWQLDYEIPRRHGVEHVLGENAGPGGLAHALRTIPLVASVARDVERLAPDALLVNFTNPEGRICTAFRRHLDQPVVGLCHEVELARRRFSKLLDRTIECRAAGLNHLTALVTARDATTGADVTSEMHDAVHRLRDHDDETYAFVRYLHDRFGVVIATSDSHAGEYYRDAVEHAAPKEFIARQTQMRSLVDEVAETISDGRADLEPFFGWETSEPLRPILRAAITGEPERISSAILPNDGLVPALAADCAVEVSAVASSKGVAGDTTVDLPLAFTATLEHEVAIQQLVADAALLGSRDAALQALLIDPVVGSSRAAEAILDDYEAAHADLWPALA
jgi:alpha-galactosidase